MIQVNALGNACPLSIITTIHVLKELNDAGTVEILVDNEVAEKQMQADMILRP